MVTRLSFRSLVLLVVTVVGTLCCWQHASAIEADPASLAMPAQIDKTVDVQPWSGHHLNQSPATPLRPLRWAENEAFRRFRFAGQVLPEWNATPAELPQAFLPYAYPLTLLLSGLSATSLWHIPQAHHLAYVYRLHLI